MPGGDGTGPIGSGALSGRGFGACNSSNTSKYSAGMGLGCRRGFGRGFRRYFVNDQIISKTQKEFLQEQKEIFESRLKEINKQLENI